MIYLLFLWGYYDKWNKIIKKKIKTILHDLSIIPRIVKFIEIESRPVISGNWLEGVMDNYCYCLIANSVSWKWWRVWGLILVMDSQQYGST